MITTHLVVEKQKIEDAFTIVIEANKEIPPILWKKLMIRWIIRGILDTLWLWSEGPLISEGVSLPFLEYSEWQWVDETGTMVIKFNTREWIHKIIVVRREGTVIKITWTSEELAQIQKN